MSGVFPRADAGPYDRDRMRTRTFQLAGTAQPSGFGDASRYIGGDFDDDGRWREDEPWIAAIFGCVSVLALSASFIWAHHWGPLAGTIVVTWVLTTLAALVLGVRSLRPRAPGRGLAILALCCASLSALAVMYTGFAFATGIDPVGACGGG
jgi:hypothetical protein